MSSTLSFVVFHLTLSTRPMTHRVAIVNVNVILIGIEARLQKVCQELCLGRWVLEEEMNSKVSEA